MRVAFVHDWLVTYRGGEKVLSSLLKLYPDAPVYTLFYDATAMPQEISSRNVVVHPIAGKLKKLRKGLLPLLPRFIESFDLTDFDLVISSSSCVAKGALKAIGAKHLCYIHSPMRYIWDQQDEYLDGIKHIPGARSIVRAFTPGLRKWDIASSSSVDRFVANSNFIAGRVQNYYQRDASVVHPVVEIDRFGCNRDKDNFYLAAGAFVSYKRFDLAIKACEQTERKLIVAGSGPMEGQLRQLAGQHTTIEISPTNERWTELMQNARGFLFPGVEDFGITAIEALASGTPLIAQKAGGAIDFVTDGQNGVFFHKPTVEDLVKAFEEFEGQSFDSQVISQYAQTFGESGFLSKMKQEIDCVLEGER